jgi:hypothetical protein
MSMSLLVVLSVAFGFYCWLSGVEVGISFLRFLRGSTLTRYGIGLFRRLWILTVILLMCSVGGFSYGFNKGLRPITGMMLTTIIVGGSCFVVRSILAIYLFYSKSRLGYSWQNILFGLTSLGTPLCLAAVGIYLLTGEQWWHTTTGWALILSFAFGLLMLAVAYVYFIVGLTPRARTRILSRFCNIGFCIFSGIVLQRSVSLYNSHLDSTSFLLYMILLAVVIVLQIALYLLGQERNMWFIMSVVAGGGPLCLALANRPYVLFPSVSLRMASAGIANGFVIALAILVVAAAGMAIYVFLIPQTANSTG